MSAQFPDDVSTIWIDPWIAGTVINEEGRAPIFLVCEHASNRLPPEAANLGCPPEVFGRHIAVDLGAEALTRALARKLNATAVLCSTSRLYIDCNRTPDDPGWIPSESDGTVIPGNTNLDEASRQYRSKQVYEPFHRMVSETLARCVERVGPPLVIPIHSYTPVMGGVSRPWEIAIMTDQEIPAQAMIRGLRGLGIIVGDNEPYDGRFLKWQSFIQHADPLNLPHFAIEVRQDLLADEASVERWAATIASVLDALGAVK
ncbi:N-formylglutamate amidohydrolase [Paraburkholderia sp. D1E]|uniref:N-formylglutamate amidohydrolase n=1 Tax=Paraburkholderia sp. D1E TaxID=3461398 RepID=UPI0040452A4C